VDQQLQDLAPRAVAYQQQNLMVAEATDRAVVHRQRTSTPRRLAKSEPVSRRAGESERTRLDLDVASQWLLHL
jgi:hypothetical protein